MTDIGLPYKWRVLIAVVFGHFMVYLDATVVNVAFRALQEAFAANVDDTQWVLSLYVMALGISTPLSGFLADRFGIKRTFLSGLAIFTLGSLCCGLAPNLWALIAARGVQGFGGGITLPLGTALLFNAFGRKERGRAVGLFGIALVVAPALGPILGGWLVDQADWRWIFFINVPIGVLGVALGAHWLREERAAQRPRFDLLGFATATLGVGACLYAASVAADARWTSRPVAITFIVGALALVGFVLVELFLAKEPLLELRLFAGPVFALATVIGWVSVVALFGAEFLLPLYLQILRGRTAFETGVILLPLALTAGAVTPLVGWLNDRIGARPLVVTGFALLALNTWQLSRIETGTSIAWIEVLLALRGVALGLTLQTTLVTALAVVPARLTSRGSALINSSRQVVQSLSVAALATVLASTLAPGLTAQLTALGQQAPATAPGQHLELCAIQPTAVSPQAYGLVQQFCGEYIQGFHHAYQITFCASLLAIFLGAAMPGWPLRRAKPSVTTSESTAGATLSAI